MPGALPQSAARKHHLMKEPSWSGMVGHSAAILSDVCLWLRVSKASVPYSSPAGLWRRSRWPQAQEMSQELKRW